LNERDGLDGVDGIAGDEGLDGAENEREPRLPPPDARAQASALTRTSPVSAIRLVMASILFVVMWSSPAPLWASDLFYP
jgi:hypothetical protein